jgi:hypothetical protein
MNGEKDFQNAAFCVYYTGSKYKKDGASCESVRVFCVF